MCCKQELLDACGGGLMQLRGIVTTYRMTTRPVPTKARRASVQCRWHPNCFLDCVICPPRLAVVVVFSWEGPRRTYGPTVPERSVGAQSLRAGRAAAAARIPGQPGGRAAWH